MHVTAYWPECDFRRRGWGGSPQTAFWLVCTEEEAKELVFPRLDAPERERSRELSRRGVRVCQEECARLGIPFSPYCFLVANDLSSIDPFHFTYPFDNLWNAYSPFKGCGPFTIGSLEEIPDLTTEQEKQM